MQWLAVSWKWKFPFIKFKNYPKVLIFLTILSKYMFIWIKLFKKPKGSSDNNLAFVIYVFNDEIILWKVIVTSAIFGISDILKLPAQFCRYLLFQLKIPRKPLGSEVNFTSLSLLHLSVNTCLLSNLMQYSRVLHLFTLRPGRNH